MTVSVRRRYAGRHTSDRDIRQAIVHFRRRISAHCFGSRQVKAGILIELLAVFGWGTSENNPHVHMALVAPDAMSHPMFNSVLRRAKAKVALFDHQFDLQPYLNEGWLEYMLDHGEDGIVLEVLSPKRPV